MTGTGVRSETRARIVGAAAELLREGGPGAVTTRGVADAAGVQAPTIYRLFGDKDGLLEAVAEHVMATFVEAKTEIVEAAAAADLDPLADLRDGWRAQIAFSLANPALFRLLSDPDRVRTSAAARSGERVLAQRVHRIAAIGRLRVSERRAVDLIQAAGIGVIQAMLSRPAEHRDPDLPDAIYEMVMAQLLTDSPARPDDGLASIVALRAMTPHLDALSAGEQRLLTEWLDRVAAAWPPRG